MVPRKDMKEKNSSQVPTALWRHLKSYWMLPSEIAQICMDKGKEERSTVAQVPSGQHLLPILVDGQLSQGQGGGWSEGSGILWGLYKWKGAGKIATRTSTKGSWGSSKRACSLTHSRYVSTSLPLPAVGTGVGVCKPVASDMLLL